jgi:hypothetical protein
MAVILRLHTPTIPPSPMKCHPERSAFQRSESLPAVAGTRFCLFHNSLPPPRAHVPIRRNGNPQTPTTWLWRVAPVSVPIPSHFEGAPGPSSAAAEGPGRPRIPIAPANPEVTVSSPDRSSACPSQPPPVRSRPLGSAFPDPFPLISDPWLFQSTMGRCLTRGVRPKGM